MSPIPGNCPRCRCEAPIGAFLLDMEARAAWSRLESRYAAHPALLARVLRYLDLHAPAGSRIHGPKLVRLLDELAAKIAQSTFAPELWALAMDTALDAASAGTLRLPLGDSFGWLLATAKNHAANPEATETAKRLMRDAKPKDLAPPQTGPADDLRELIADLAHWERMDRAGHSGADVVLDGLRAKYRAATGTDWATPAGSPA